MLVFTRRCYEAVIIDEEVEVTVLDIREGGEVCLRVTAPAHILISRKEDCQATKSGAPQSEGARLEACDDRPEPVEPDDANVSAAPREQVILSRQRDESIMIGDTVEVMVVEVRLDIRSNRVRLGIAAPRNIPVHRKEVHEAIKRTNEHRAPHGTDEAADQV